LLGAKRLWIGLVVIVGIAIAASFALARLVSSEGTPFWAAATLVQALTLALTLGVLRHRGYRLRRRRR